MIEPILGPNSSEPSATAELRSDEQLTAIFHESEKPASEFRIGAEAEKFGILRPGVAPLPYRGAPSVLVVFNELERRFGWQPHSEFDSGPVIALTRGEANITLEPGGQLELSGAPGADLHAVHAEIQLHLTEMREIGDELGIDWLSIGFHPTALRSELPWVPKRRYPVMRRYLPTRGSRALDMMQRTATVQANFDYSDEADALRKLMLALRLTPVIQAMTANSPFIEGRVSKRRSERADVWLHMDPDRSGLIDPLWDCQRPGYIDYVRWAQKAGMFMVSRDGLILDNAGQPFGEFMRDGFDGQRARLGDWITHLNSLFPEARLKRTLEWRSADALPPDLLSSVPALFTGLLYDEQALSRAEALVEGWTLTLVQDARREIPLLGLDARVGGQSVLVLAQQLIEIAKAGLQARGRLDPQGRDESVYLEPLSALIAHKRVPADLLLDRVSRRPGKRGGVTREELRPVML